MTAPRVEDGLLQRARVAWAQCDRAQVEAALQALEALAEDERATIAWLLANGGAAEALDALRAPIAFGTGGVRGPVGVGPNRVNPTVVAALAAGHAAVLRQQGGRAVVIGYDGRQFLDLGGRFGGRVPAWTSQTLAQAAAAAYCQAGLRVWLAPTPSPTPMVSWATRQLAADGALVVTASHNPPDDNGVKLLDRDGVQLVPPLDDAVIAARGAVADAVVPGEVCAWPAGLADDFIAFAAEVGDGGSPVRVAVSALHGVGQVAAVLRRAGHAVVEEAAQARVDGAFPTLAGGVANPELASVWPAVLAVAEAHDATLALVTDPDGDRLGVAVRGAPGWVRLSGDQTAVILVQHAIHRLGGDARGRVIARTCVTSSLVDALAEAAGATLLADEPVGFKHLVDAARAHGLARLLVAVEESCGALVSHAIGDKDAHTAAIWLVDAHRAAADAGHTLLDVLAAVEARFGVVRTGLARVVVTPLDRDRWTTAVLAAALHAPVVAGRPVRSRVDLAATAGDSPSARRARTLVTLELAPAAGEQRARLVVRPSGTEPLLKLYVELRGAPGVPAASLDVDGLVQAARDWALSLRGDAATA